jgi:hypothetical protein
VTELPDLRFSKPNFVRKTMCEIIEKIALVSVYFLVFYESKKYFKGTLFSLKHPDEVITR